MSTNEQSIVHEGWLTKSPPTNSLWRARWRRRWFSLRHSGELPDQYVLTYYADRQCRKLKGSIDLDQCEQVDLGLRMYEKKMKFDYVFDIKTPNRIYYLAADSENEMKTWVGVICRVCALKCTGNSIEIDLERAVGHSDIEIVEEQDDSHENNTGNSPPISPVSSGPYIRISECFTGKSPVLDHQDLRTILEQNLKNTNFRNAQHSNETYEFPQPTYLNCIGGELDPRFYDCPRKLNPNFKSSEDEAQDKDCQKQTPQSPTDSESVFTDDDWAQSPTEHNTSRNTKPSDSSISGLDDSRGLPPPRPPKPPHIVPTKEYLNLTLPNRKPTKVNKESIDVPLTGIGDAKVLSDDMYDFPRSHQVETESTQNTLARRHNYNNAAPVSLEGHIFKYDISPRPGTSTTVFRYDLEDFQQDEPASPASQTSSTAQYSNLPSPIGVLEPPPIINRDLKPRRTRSDSMSTASNPEPPSPHTAPSIDRKLKPLTPSQTTGSMRKAFESEEDRRSRAAPSPTPPGSARSHDSIVDTDKDEQIYYHFTGDKKMQYLDLDLDLNTSKFSQGDSSTLPSRSPGASTVYKRVDFMKTEAFNLTRNNLEKERNKESIAGVSFKK